MSLKKLLHDKGISIGYVSRQLSVNHSTISRIINGKYNGSKETKKKVLDYIKNVALQDKVEMTDTIYQHASAFKKLFYLGAKSTRFNDEETLVFFDLYKTMKLYLEKQQPKKTA